MAVTTNPQVTGTSNFYINSTPAIVDSAGNTYAFSRVVPVAVPMYIPSSGTMGNNGAVSGLTSMTDVFAPQGAYLYFPANAIVAGSAAGLYYSVIAAGTTTATVYNNMYTSGIPTIPATPTPFVTTGPGAFTQTTATDITLLSITLAANELGNSGYVRCPLAWALTNSVNNKILSAKINTTAFWSNSAAPLTTSGLFEQIAYFQMRGSSQRQRGNRSNNAGYSGGASGTANNLNIDMSVATTINITGQIANATEFLGLVGGMIEIIPGA